MNKRPVIAITGDYDTEKNTYYVKPPYIEAIRLAGGVPVVLYPRMDVPQNWSGDAANWIEAYDLEEELLERIDGILFTGGDDVGPMFYQEPVLRVNGEIIPQRDIFEIKLVREAVKRDIPCFGICRGIQTMAAALGAALVQDIYAEGNQTRCQHGQKATSWFPTHSVSTKEGSQLRSILGARAWVNSFHHQAVAIGEDTPFEITAYSEDGIIEGIEKPELRYFVGVQWHPERMLQDPLQRGLFEALVSQAGLYAREK